ncbi:MAG: hypothetical protein ACOX37_00540 [Bacillota bacterium]
MLTASSRCGEPRCWPLSPAMLGISGGWASGAGYVSRTRVGSIPVQNPVKTYHLHVYLDGGH